MQQFRSNLTRLKTSMGAKLPDGNDVYGYSGVTKAVLLSAIDYAYELSQGIQATDETRFEVIALKRAGSELYRQLKDFLDSDVDEATKKERFDSYLNSFSALIEKTKLTYFIVAKNGLRDDQELTKIRAQITAIGLMHTEYRAMVEKAKEEGERNALTLQTIVASHQGVKNKVDEVMLWHESIQKQSSELTDIHKNVAGLDKDIRKFASQFQQLNKKTTELAERSSKDQEAIQSQYSDFAQIHSDISKSREEHKAFLEQIKDTLGDANRMGMAASFKARKDELQNQQLGWQIVFVLTMLMIFFTVWGYVIPKIGNGQASDLMMEIALVSPLVWLGWFAAKQYGYISKIREDYAFKSAAAMAYEGYKKAARHVDKPLEGVLLEFSLFNMAQNPIRLYGDTDAPASPVNEFFDRAVNKLERYNKVKASVPNVAAVEVEGKLKTPPPASPASEGG